MQGEIGLEDLRLARAIGEAGTLTAAARRLGVDHSTAFRRLGTLEARLRVRLFERARDGYVPTPAGETIIAAAGRMLRDLGDLERRGTHPCGVSTRRCRQWSRRYGFSRIRTCAGLPAFVPFWTSPRSG